MHHLAIPPVAFGSVVGMLGACGLNEDAHVIIEKPFGTDLASARALNETVHKVFDESCIFRIDHFLGKEAIDNILAFRFANGLFEPIWNRNHVSYVQIDVPETLSIEGRAEFYDKTGAYRDMIVTHLLQVVGFVAMEPPSSLAAKALRDEKTKVFDAMRPIDVTQVVRGQYKGYRDEPGVAKRSQTETFIAAKVFVDNWRWHGVPFYLRTGKSLAQSRQVITMGFHGPALKMFPVERRRDPRQPSQRARDRLQGSRVDHRELPHQGTRPAHAARRGRHVRSGTPTRGPRRTTSRATSGSSSTRCSATRRCSPPRTASSGCGRSRCRCSTTRAPVESYAPGSWGPPSIKQLIAPFQWRLPE